MDIVHNLTSTETSTCVAETSGTIIFSNFYLYAFVSHTVRIRIKTVCTLLWTDEEDEKSVCLKNNDLLAVSKCCLSVLEWWQMISSVLRVTSCPHICTCISV